MDNEFYKPDLEQECKQCMLSNLRIWIAFLEVSPYSISINNTKMVNEILDITDKDIEDIDFRDLALIYDKFVMVFTEESIDPSILRKLLKMPIVFQLPKI